MIKNNDQEPGSIEGGQVFLFGKHIKNDGRIVSSGDGARTHITTENYEGVGTVESHANIKEEQSFLKTNLVSIVVGAIATIAGGLILFYFFGIR